MRDAVKVLAAIVCVASASGIDLIDGFLKGFSIGNRGEDDDDDDFKGKARSDRSFLSDLENAHGACVNCIVCLFIPRKCDPFRQQATSSSKTDSATTSALRLQASIW